MMTAKDPAAVRAALMGAVKRNKTVHRLVPIVGVGEGQESRRTFAALVSAKYFGVLAVPLLQGRGSLTAEKGQSWTYGWSPDGDKILFAGFRDGFWNVWWVSRSTKRQQPLTNYRKLNAFVRYPSWSPKGNQVVYEYSETIGNIWIADLK